MTGRWPPLVFVRFATVTYARTGLLRELQECLRHGSLSTTQRYVGVDWQGMRRVVDAA